MNYQISRVIYTHEKTKAIKAGVIDPVNGNIEFELFSFFEVCYHLKNWVKESEQYAKFNDVEEYITRDLCTKEHNSHKNEIMTFYPVGLQNGLEKYQTAKFCR